MHSCAALCEGRQLLEVGGCNAKQAIQLRAKSTASAAGNEWTCGRIGTRNAYLMGKDGRLGEVIPDKRRSGLHPIKLLEPLEQWRYPPREVLPLAGQGTLYEFALRFWSNG